MRRMTALERKDDETGIGERLISQKT